MYLNEIQKHGVAVSTDGRLIHLDCYPGGSLALVFVHGWCCDRHYWDAQVAFFSPRYTVICLDLAGHGDSGGQRTRWSAPAFGDDVAAVVRHIGLAQVVLIGHSMGGSVIVEAARRLSTSAIGLVGADTWSVGRSRQAIEQFIEPFRTDFATSMERFVRTSFSSGADQHLVERVAKRDVVGNSGDSHSDVHRGWHGRSWSARGPS